ncbi:MAG: hypothetical protein JSS81_19635 [Acidobacteria bacterium]|nr:hypothetical protein [Acidobacteriota bacterium]
MSLKDIELKRYRNFLRKESDSDAEKEEKLWREFKTVLENSVRFLDPSQSEINEALKNTIEKKIERKGAKKNKFVRILKSGKRSLSGDSGTKENAYVKFDGYERTLLAGIWLDAYLLNESVYQKINNGTSLKDTAEKLKTLLPTHKYLPNKFPVDGFCYFVESENPENDKNEIFADLLGDNYREIDLHHSFLAVNLDDDRPTVVIVPNDKEIPQLHHSSSKLFGEVIQEYFLSFAKVVNETELTKRTKNGENFKNLKKCLDRINENPPKSLGQIEKENRELTNNRTNFAEDIFKIERNIHTADINIYNAEDFLNHSLLRSEKEKLAAVLVRPLKHKLEQARADLAYLKLIEEKAKINAEEISNLSNLQAGIYARKLAWFFGILTLIGTLQLFKNFTEWTSFEQLNWIGWEVVLLKTAILIGVVLTAGLIIFKKDFIEFRGLSKDKIPQTKTASPDKQTVPGSPAGLNPAAARTEFSGSNSGPKSETKEPAPISGK